MGASVGRLFEFCAAWFWRLWWPAMSLALVLVLWVGSLWLVLYIVLDVLIAGQWHNSKEDWAPSSASWASRRTFAAATGVDIERWMTGAAQPELLMQPFSGALSWSGFALASSMGVVAHHWLMRR